MDSITVSPMPPTTVISTAVVPVAVTTERVSSDAEFEDLLYLLDEAPPPPLMDLSGVTTAELRGLCNRVFRELDHDFPRVGARDDYQALLEELQTRSQKPPR